MLGSYHPTIWKFLEGFKEEQRTRDLIKNKERGI